MFNEQLSKINNELEKISQLQKEVNVFSKEYRDLLEQEIGLLKQKKELLKQLGDGYYGVVEGVEIYKGEETKKTYLLKDEIISGMGLTQQQTNLFFKFLKDSMIRHGIYSLADIYHQYKNIEPSNLNEKVSFLESIVGKYHLATLMFLMHLADNCIEREKYEKLMEIFKDFNIDN